jgi:hypothetical protein
MKIVAETLGVSHSNLHARLNGSAKPRRRYHKAKDGERVNATGSREPANVLPLITTLVAARPAYGYRRITALLNRQLRAQGNGPVNHKRVYCIMKAHNLLLARRYTERPELTHEGKVKGGRHPRLHHRRARSGDHLLASRRERWHQWLGHP